MATGPHVVVAKEINFVQGQPMALAGALDDGGSGRIPYYYYPSQKVLGKLYRAIDEVAVFQELQSQKAILDPDDPTAQSIMQRVWNYVRHETSGFQWQHHQEWARDVQET